MRAVAVAVVALLASPAFAQEGFYVGLGAGRFDYQEDAGFLGPEPFEDSVASWKVYGGFEINENLGFEIRYGGMEEIEQSSSGTDPSVGDFVARFDLDITTTTVAAMGFLPRGWGALFAGIGYYDSETSADLELVTDCCGTLTDDISVRDDGFMAVLGLEWRMGRFGTGLGVRLEYEWLDVESADASTLGVGVAYRF